MSLSDEVSNAWRGRREASKHSGGEAARPGLCIYLLLYLQGSLALGPHISAPMLPSGGGLSLLLRGAQEQGVIFLQ